MSLWTKFSNVTIHMKATEQYFRVVLFIMLYKVVLTFESVDEILTNVVIQMKAIEQSLSCGGVYYAAHGMWLTVEPVDDIL